MNIISVKQLREGLESVRMGVLQGNSYIVVHRSRPFGKIVPLDGHEGDHENGTESREERIRRNLEQVRKLAGGFKLGKSMTPDEMNRAYDEDVYGPLIASATRERRRKKSVKGS